MKLGSLSLAGKFFVIALIPALAGTGCKTSSDQAAAAIPPSSAPSLFPSSLQAAPTDDSGIWAGSDSGSKPIEAPKKSEPKPFTLRSGETLASYKVQKGDTLGKIAARYGTSVSRIQAANKLSGTKILAGKTYKIPTKKTEAEIAAAGSSFAPEKKKTTVTTTVSAPKPPSHKPTSTTISSSPSRSSSSFGSTSSSFSSNNSSDSTYSPPEPRTFSPPPSSSPPTFTPRNFDYSGPTISSPERSASSITIPSDESDSSGNGAAFPSPTFGSGSSF